MMIRFLQNILALIVNPERGWEDVSHHGAEPSELCRDAFYPLLGLASLTSLGLLWHVDVDDVSVVMILQRAIITFTAYFATMFFAQFVYHLTLGNLSERIDNSRSAPTFVIYCLSIMAIITMIGNLLPVDLPLVEFLPLYLIFIIWKGRRYMGIPDERAGKFMLLSVGIIIAPIYVIFFLFDIMVK